QFICGARAKYSGKQCQARPLVGKRRCKFHGGATPPRMPEQREAQRKFVATQPRVRGRLVEKLEAQNGGETLLPTVSPDGARARPAFLREGAPKSGGARKPKPFSGEGVT